MTDIKKKIIGLIDLTSLGADDTPEQITALCARARQHEVAAVCVWPKFVATAKAALGDGGVKIATVVNFPSGEEKPEQITADIKKALADGADEIDIVFPWRNFLAGRESDARAVLEGASKACGGKTLKVILESGMFPDQASLARASGIALMCGAHFLKTSTGKAKVGATPEAARTLLTAIKKAKRPAGFKASGGIRDFAGAEIYLAIAAEIMGEAWITPATFRFGASSLLDDLVAARPSAGPADSKGPAY